MITPITGLVPPSGLHVIQPDGSRLSLEQHLDQHGTVRDTPAGPQVNNGASRWKRIATEAVPVAAGLVVALWILAWRFDVAPPMWAINVTLLSLLVVQVYAAYRHLSGSGKGARP